MTFIVRGGPSVGAGWMHQFGTAGLTIENVGLNCDSYKLSLGFAEPRGYGDRCYEIEIKPEGFRDFAAAMIRTDRESAIKAFGAALQTDVSERIERDRIWRPNQAANAA